LRRIGKKDLNMSDKTKTQNNTQNCADAKASSACIVRLRCNINKMCKFCKLQEYPNKYIKPRWVCERFETFLEQNEETLEIYSVEGCELAT